MTGPEYGCDRCGVTVPDGAGEYRGDERLCGDCFDDLGPVCGDCSDSLDDWAEWAAAVDDLPDPEDRTLCVRCGA